jgi:hypothetical protein
MPIVQQQQRKKEILIGEIKYNIARGKENIISLTKHKWSLKQPTFLSKRKLLYPS